jgi:hypothetical protein
LNTTDVQRRLAWREEIIPESVCVLDEERHLWVASIQAFGKRRTIVGCGGLTLPFSDEAIARLTAWKAEQANKQS